GRALIRELLSLLELPAAPRRLALDEPSPCQLPLLGELLGANGDPLLWILEAQPLDAAHDPDTDPLALPIHQAQLATLPSDEGAPAVAEPQPADYIHRLGKGSDWLKLLSTTVYTQPRPPRWVILASPRQWLLLDRAKFA